MNFYCNVKSDLYRLFHSLLLYIHIFIPTAGICLFLWYYSYSIWNELDKLSAYIQALSICYPVLIGIITSNLADMEQKAANFQTLLSTPMQKCIPHLTKLATLIAFGFASTLFSLLAFGYGFRLLGYTTFHLVFFIFTAIPLLVSVFPLYVLQYIVSFVFGKGYSLGLGIVGSLLAALLQTGLGDGLWSFLPWGIAARFSESLLIAHAMHIDFFDLNGMIQGIISVVFFSLLFLTIFILVFEKWEGRKSED